MPLEQLPLPIPHWRDLLEILIVAYVIYRLLRFLVGTRALQILLGLLVLAVIYLAALIVFQPELRQALARLGQSRVFRVFGATEPPLVAGEIAEAVERLSRSATGAIIATERDIRLDEYLESGTRMRATVSADLLATNFSPYSPLHDGAVLSEETDAMVLVVSEETATISLALRGTLERGLTTESVRVLLVRVPE